MQTLNNYPEINVRSDMVVELIDSMASDQSVIRSAQVSAKGKNDPTKVPERFINALMEGRHGSPFEHSVFTFYVNVPIFVAREWMRHRIGSFNEMSGRYTELKPDFYIPGEERPLINHGTSMKPKFEHGTNSAKEKLLLENLNVWHEDSSAVTWSTYTEALDAGIAKEVARGVLPVNIYTEFYWTVNARSLMNFISLRGIQEGAKFPSHPQFEIQRAAMQVENLFKGLMPITHQTFVNNGLVAP